MVLSVGEFPLTLRMDYLYSNTLHKRFAKELSDTPSRNKAELSALMEKLIAGDDYRRAKASVGKGKKEKPQEKKHQEPNAQKRTENQTPRERRRSPLLRQHHTYTALRYPREDVLGSIDGRIYEIKWRRKHRESRATRESISYWKFHKQRGHPTES